MCKVTLPDIVRAIPTCVKYAREIARLPTKDAMKQYLSDNISDATNDPAKFIVPSAYPVMVTEKDIYIASVLRECPGTRIVAVVGKGHVDGIKQHLCDKDDSYLLRAELSRTTRFSQSPLARQSVLAAGVLTAVTGAVASVMARRLNRTSTSRIYRGTIPITLLLLTLEVGAGWMWLTNEWLKFHTAVTHAVVTYRDEEEIKRDIGGNKKR
jgi:pheromone shutdown protein TraB